MKMNLLIITATAFFLAFVPSGRAAVNALNAQLNTPQLLSLQATIAAPSNDVPVQLAFLYNTRGQITCAAGSTIDGLPVVCAGKQTRRGTNISYTLKLKVASTPPTTIVLSGVVGTNAARCTYKGPKGRATIAAQPVTVSTTAPVPLQMDLVSSVDSKNRITGTGNILAYDTNGPLPGKLKGTVSSNTLAWKLTQSPRSVAFKGTRSGDLYVGSLKVSAPPAKETITSFSVPVSAFVAPSGLATFRGAVMLASNSLPEPAQAARITVKSDRNNDGRFTGTETVSVLADAQGRYEIPILVQIGRPVLLDVTFPGFAKHLASYPEVAPGAAVTRHATLQALRALSVEGRAAKSDDGKITLTGLPAAIASVQARVFNPVTEIASFPGQFRDSQSNLLISSVFSAIEAKNAAGAPVTNLGPDAILCMEVPRDTWPTLRDLHAGNGQIDIPLYYYDEAAGEWRRNAGDGWLEDTNKIKIAEAQLASIRDGSFVGRVCGVGPITHLSYWNIDWPISTHTCIEGIIVDTNATPVSGAVVTVRGVTYTGRSSPHVTLNDGAFCADILRSEGVGEEVDGDGIPGGTQQVSILVQDGTNYYSFGPYNSPQTQATCETGGGLSLGLLALDEGSRLAVSTCTITGRVVFSGTSVSGTSPLNPGAPIPDAIVFGYDPESGDLADPSNHAFTDADGYFSLSVPILSGVTLHGMRFDSVGSTGYDLYSSTASFVNCPPSLVTLNADFSSVRFLFLELTGAGVEFGSLLLQDDGLPVVAIATSTQYYTTLNTAPASRPTSTGVWLTLNLVDLDDAPAGTITFTVNSLSPISGTWTTSTLALGGTFSE